MFKLARSGSWVVMGGILILMINGLYCKPVFAAKWNWNPFNDEASGLSETNCSMEAQHLYWSCTLNDAGRKCNQARQRYNICRDLQDIRSEHRRNGELRRKIRDFEEWQRGLPYEER